MKAEIHDLVAAGDRVALRATYSGTDKGGFIPRMPPTGKPFELETMYIIRLNDEGKIAEHWGIGDMVGVMAQLGLLPAALFLLEGTLTVYAGDQTLTAGAGAFFFLPNGIPHSFVVESGSARLLMIVAPSGVLAMFSEVEERVGPREMSARPRHKDIAAVAPQLEEHGVRLVGPNPRHSDPNGDRPHA